MNLLGAAALTAALALPAVARFELTPQSAEIQIGTPFDITGKAILPEGYFLRVPAGLRRSPPGASAAADDEPSIDTGAFAILDVALDPPKETDGETAQTVRMRALVFGLGQQTLPAISWPLEARGGGAAGESGETIESAEVKVTVSPPRPGINDKKGDIRPIKGPYSPPLWPWLLSAAILIAATGAGLYAWRRRLQNGGRRAATPAPVDTRTPEEIALAEITALPGLGLAVKEFYDRLSDILRLYLERRCAVRALSMTTFDLQRSMIEANVEPKARSLMKTLLERCDLAKFARHQPAEEDLDRDCQTGKEIVCILSPQQRSAVTVHDLAGESGR